MHYYIDGYNYLFRTLASGVNLKLHREALIYDLNQKASLLNLEMTIVFDAQYQEGDETITHFGSLEIIYTAENQTADELLIKILDRSAQPKQSILITSDNKLSRQAKIIQTKTQSTEEFIEWVNKRYKNRILDPESDEKENAQKLKKESLLKEEVALSNPQKPKNLTDYYEMTFTKRLEKTSNPEKIEIKKETKKVNPAPPQQVKNQTNENDFDRWLRLFGGT